MYAKNNYSVMQISIVLYPQAIKWGNNWNSAIIEQILKEREIELMLEYYRTLI